VFGVLVMGVRRSTFSNEAGLGSAPIAHSAAKTNEPVREGIVALLEPFIDTVIICNITAIVIILTGVWNDPNLPLPADFNVGVALTKYAFQTVIPWFPAILVICVILFAYSTMISWCYYGERAWIYLADHFGEGVGIKTLLIYRIVFVAFAYIGTVTKLGAVLDFSDIMILSMAFPNVLGCVLLSPKVYRRVEDYWPV
jgi:AGCS family alanine or glycine:cation symporter